MANAEDLRLGANLRLAKIEGAWEESRAPFIYVVVIQSSVIAAIIVVLLRGELRIAAADTPLLAGWN
jgi:hypothetical protein